MVRRLAPVEREEALGVGAQLGDVARVEGLERTADAHAPWWPEMCREADRRHLSVNPKQSRLSEDIILLNFSVAFARTEKSALRAQQLEEK